MAANQWLAKYAHANPVVDESSFLLYRPSRNVLTKGNPIANIIFHQMLYWGSRQENDGDSFYKFVKPCDHELYKAGDSWIEELGFSYKIFTSALKCIATKVTTNSSKQALLKTISPETMILYWTDSCRVTHWLVNWPVVNLFLEALATNQLDALSEIKTLDELAPMPDRVIYSGKVPSGNYLGKCQKGNYLGKVPSGNYLSSSTENTSEITSEIREKKNEKIFSGSTSTENSQASKPLVHCPEKTEASGVTPTTPGKDQYSAPVRVKKTLGALQGGSNREYQKAMAERAALTLFQSEEEESSFYRWAKGRFDYNGEQQADIATARLRNKAKATPRDKELLSQFRNSTSSPQQAPELTRGERMALAAEEYKKDPSMLQKDVVAFRRDHGVSLTNFKCYLFKVGLVG